MQELSILLGNINCKWDNALKLRGEMPEDVPPKDYCDFVAARLVDAGYLKEKNESACRPRCGNWIEKPYLFGTTRYCSLCGENYGMPHGMYNYCPNCGAKMEETT